MCADVFSGVVPRCAEAAAAGPSVFRGGPVTAATLEERNAIAARQRAAAQPHEAPAALDFCEFCFVFDCACAWCVRVQ